MVEGKTVVIVGGGIAGITCVESLFLEHELAGDSSPISHIVLISDSCLVKRTSNIQKKGRNLESFDIEQIPIEKLSLRTPEGLKFSSLLGSVININHSEKILTYQQQNSEPKQLKYDILSLCHGSKPKQLDYGDKKAEIDERVVVLRDLVSVDLLRERLASCRHIVLVGNGGISLELIEQVSRCRKTWLVRDKSIGASYFDPGAAKFLLESRKSSRAIASENNSSKPLHTSIGTRSHGIYGPALGPDWCQENLVGCSSASTSLDIVYNDEVKNIKYLAASEYPLSVLTRNSKQFDCDLVIVAIGVEPNKINFVPEHPQTSSDGSIIIDKEMRTSLDSVYAAGDVVSCENWDGDHLWFQMHLWTQARQMGFYQAKCIVGHLLHDDLAIHQNFECFTHCTRFLGQRVVLLGRFNGQGYEAGTDQLDVLVRINPEKDYVKLIKKGGRIVGAVLIGDSGLEETIENLIYDKTDVSAFKDQLLDNTVDIEDFFD